MPLPPDCSLSLLGYSRPGDTVHSNPKQAIIIRLSTEILDALESSPDAIKLDFSDNPIFWAGSTHFAMNASKENLHHELYLRTSSATKKNAPLKLHANVIGKFQVERQLDTGVRDKLRQSTKTLHEQRQERGIIQLETPPTQPVSKVTKKNSIRVKAPRVTLDHAKVSARDAVPHRVKKEVMRRRIIQLLAVNDRTADEISKLLGGLYSSSSADLLDLLEQLAETYSNEGSMNAKTPKIYRLKLKTWTEVHPVEWDWANEHERSTVSIKYENALRRLSIPETDALWEYSIHRNGRMSTGTAAVPTGHVGSTSSKTEGQSQRSGMVVKDKRVKPSKTDSGSEEPFKDENITSGKSHGSTQQHEEMSLLSVPKASAPLRKPPGSGFRSGKLLSTAAVDPGNPNRTRDPGTKLRDSTLPLHGRPVAAAADRQRESSKKTDTEPGHGRPTIKKVQETLHKDEGDGYSVAPEAINSKRRTVTRDPDPNIEVASLPEPLAKKRKVDRNPANTAGLSSKEYGPRGQTPKKSIKRPEHPVRHRSRDQLVSVSRTKASSPSSLLDNLPSSRNMNGRPGTSSRRRRSPIYTSSDDEAESTQISKDMMHQQTLPTDHESLRRRYNKSYSEYLAAFHKLVTQRDKIDGILRKHDGNTASSLSDSDADLGLIDPDELGRLCSIHKRLRDELELIQRVFLQSNGREC